MDIFVYGDLYVYQMLQWLDADRCNQSKQVLLTVHRYMTAPVAQNYVKDYTDRRHKDYRFVWKPYALEFPSPMVNCATDDGPF